MQYSYSYNPLPDEEPPSIESVEGALELVSAFTQKGHTLEEALSFFGSENAFRPAYICMCSSESFDSSHDQLKFTFTKCPCEQCSIAVREKWNHHSSLPYFEVMLSPLPIISIMEEMLFFLEERSLPLPNEDHVTSFTNMLIAYGENPQASWINIFDAGPPNVNLLQFEHHFLAAAFRQEYSD